ncbi:hypothetical protein L5515_015545 [Caenorhabditis briggsae]|uniref:RING-type domain-containing protein n=1 Tax=Caenorhabditis briggsae TaxID=6238 RepID=A0AAE9EC16_CAEBR|nr:hypothetical protein L5515_015545 [Caenorhabditis briggsae]
MLHLESLICYSCKTDNNKITLFDNDSRRAFVGSCGHSICLTCAKSNPHQKCPKCQKNGAFENGTINFSSSDIIENYEKNVFDIIRKSTHSSNSSCGFCSECGANELLRMCETCFSKKLIETRRLSKYAICVHCATSLKYINGELKPLSQGSEECEYCKDPNSSNILWNMEHLDMDSFKLCADCVLNDHQEHRTFKISPQTESFFYFDVPVIRNETSIPILSELLKKKLHVPHDKTKCELRYMRMQASAEKVIQALHGRLGEHTKEISKEISCLELQYNDYHLLNETCACVKVWKNIVDSNAVDVFGNCPHFDSLVKKNKDLTEGCPWHYESSENEKKELMEIIEKGEDQKSPLNLELVVEDILDGVRLQTGH